MFNRVEASLISIDQNNTSNNVGEENIKDLFLGLHSNDTFKESSIADIEAYLNSDGTTTIQDIF